MTLGWEKRSARRIPINCPLQIMLPDGREFLGVAHDLSIDGILFDCPAPLDPAQAAEVRLLPLAGSVITPLHAAIEVIRCDPTESPLTFRVAAALRATK